MPLPSHLHPGPSEYEAEHRLARANSREEWDRLWSHPESRDWREGTMRNVYDAILRRVPKGSRVVDLGGGVGHLGLRLKEERGCDVTIVDLSPVACGIARDKGLSAVVQDLREVPWPACHEDLFPGPPVHVVATELLEHLDDRTLANLMRALRGAASEGAVCRFLFSVPDDRLGPETCRYHARRWDQASFEGFLRDSLGSPLGLAVLVDAVPDPAYLLGDV